MVDRVIGPGDRSYQVAQRWLLGCLERMLSRTQGADFEITALIRRVKTGQIVWRGKLPGRDWTKDKKR